MKVCVDVGNTTIKIGFFENTLVKKLVFATEFKKAFEYESLIKSQLDDSIELFNVEQVMYSSVVPSIDIELIQAFKNMCNCSVIKTLDHKNKLNITIEVKNPLEVGADIIADLVGAREKYSCPLIVIDFGTATKILYLNEHGGFQVCIIMPGFSLSGKALSSKAALLPEINYDSLCKISESNDTLTAMANGLIYSHVDGVMGIVNRIENELGNKCKKIMTGGATRYLSSLFNDEYILDENLNLEGLLKILQLNQ